MFTKNDLIYYGYVFAGAIVGSLIGIAIKNLIFSN